MTKEKNTKKNMQKESSSRLYGLDLIRGVTLLSMIGFHGMWDLVYLFGVSAEWMKGTAGYLWQQSICWTFILLSGFCWSLGRQQMKRGIQVWCCGLLISVVTWVVMPESKILFGILTFLGTAMLLLIPIQKFLEKITPLIGAAGSMLLFLLFRNINDGWLGFEKWNLVKLPEALYEGWAMTYLGFTPKSFWSTDYFAVLPWFFLFVTGYFLYRYLQEKDRLSVFRARHMRRIEWLGQHSLWVYLLHQPLVYGVLYIVFRIG